MGFSHLIRLLFPIQLIIVLNPNLNLNPIFISNLLINLIATHSRCYLHNSHSPQWPFPSLGSPPIVHLFFISSFPLFLPFTSLFPSFLPLTSLFVVVIFLLPLEAKKLSLQKERHSLFGRFRYRICTP